MYGNNAGSLKVREMPYYDHTSDGTYIFDISGDKGNVWRLGQATLFVPTTNVFEIIIEGVIGANHEGDIAVDDIKIHAGQCVGEYNHIVHQVLEQYYFLNRSIIYFFLSSNV